MYTVSTAELTVLFPGVIFIVYQFVFIFMINSNKLFKTEVVVVRIGPLLIYLDLVETNYKSPSKEFAHFKFRMWESLVMLRTGKH